MRLMFAQMFSTFTLFFAGLEKFVSAFARLGGVCDRSVELYEKTLEIEHQQKLNELLKATKATDRTIKAAA